MFAGYVTLEDTLHAALQARSGDLPIQADALPFFRVYGPAGLLASAGGQAVQRESGAITGATNANPIVIASAGHNLTTGMRVKIAGVGGNTNANTAANITKVDADHFSLDGVAGNSAYTAGGTWVVAGLYDLPIVASAANGFVAGETYTVVANYEVSSSAQAQLFSFCVL